MKICKINPHKSKLTVSKFDYDGNSYFVLALTF